MADLKKQAEELKSSVSDLGNFDPLAKTQKEIERAFETPEMASTTEALAKSASETPAALPEPVQQVDVNVPLPELPAPVSEKDFAPAEVPPAKQARGTG